jgi:hypothetical protein
VTLEDALREIWRKAMAEGAAEIELEGRRFPVRRTRTTSLRQVDFVFRGEALRGLEQNPRTGSRWAALARSGAKVMQFLSSGHYIGVVVDGKVTLYGKPPAARSSAK